MKIAIASTAFLGLASAFAPSATVVRQSTQLYSGKDEGEMSKALPFVPRPKMLDGTLAGDVGFDPFNFAGEDMSNLLWMREAEVKHSRLAMLAVVGWPLAELWDKSIADAAGLPSLLTTSGASPSLLNGGLAKIDPVYWFAVALLAGIVELSNADVKEAAGADYAPGDCGFDPLGLFPADKEGQKQMQTKELKHGRIAMMAVLGFVAQEALYRTPVVNETPFFFHPLF
ncbi:b binding protein 6, chloroplastic [Seminavis robusta]|uniref:B binding protein 6, chloroplastic n=1 Tax=Seminavis robusta TaxID=568900 RepID=A0A9N8EPM0_9STRA|nr:b binding protein 6, chloroplastic [Seminavis robusta]|eukprot:Sro1347_g264950.1 b binding protein 6, chloroplastic (228) ;mRNA; r:26041-26906